MLWEDKSKDAIRKLLADLKDNRQSAIEFTYDRAFDFSEERMASHTTDDLEQRFSMIQAGADITQRIQPATLGLTKRYLDDRSVLFSGVMHSELRDEEGNIDQDATKELRDADEAAEYQEVMDQVERMGNLFRSCGLLYQSINGKLSPTLVLPQAIRPIEPDAGEPFNPVDPGSYPGHIIRLDSGERDATKEITGEKTFALIDEEKTVVYQSDHAGKATHTINEIPNKYGPHMPLRFWHPLKPTEHIIPEHDVSIVDANRELNVAWSYVQYLFKVQGGSVLSVTDQLDEVATDKAYSPVHPYMTQIGGSASFLNPAVNWTGLIATQQAFIKLWGILQGMTPGDFELDPRAVQSGFAKVIESLPKIENREKLQTYGQKQERREWPRRRDIYLVHKLITPKHAGKPGLTLYTTFEARPIPKSVDETIKEFEFDLKNNITTPAEILSRREGITVEDAQQKIDENAAVNKKTSGGGSLASLIGASGEEEKPGDANEEENETKPEDNADA